MDYEMRVVQIEDDKVATFMHQMIPHHANAVNMAKVLLKNGEFSGSESDEEIKMMMHDIIRVQNYQITFMNGYLGGATGAICDESTGKAVTTRKLQSAHVSRKKANRGIRDGKKMKPREMRETSSTTFNLKWDYTVGEFGYYIIDGYDGVSPTITMEIGTTYTFDQQDSTNWCVLCAECALMCSSYAPDVHM
ncbi:hypothetical protein CYMTET_15045 [Cymbomonas tetramitiformis]|uniref:DUF305 domain-containing protein n=1 Tax=Cymbomonas tetramitiformis TaxID=36881 RepID=A0AAE0GF50_9CHLO|nr:hypothetical protein CYMTET_15045 [Cymbomonas tetramitiformis]